uniref:Uncharacterized protein n=1 Tax=Avena sativa TaxID=4498 RepID=A0ACD5U9R9_AVESA
MAAQEGSDGDANTVPPTPMSAPASFKFNVHAPEFVPMSPTAAATTPMSAPAGGYYSPFLQMQAAPDWSFLHDHEPVFFMPDFAHAKFAAAAAASNSAGAKGGAGGGTTDVAQKIVKQVEYQFSDINLVANEFLLKIMNKDSEGYVPLSVISSWKKIKSLGATNQMLVKALRTSTKLIVSDDGKKVRRRQAFTEKHKEELQSRMIIAENLPEDSSRNSLEKVFGVVGSVKNIKICHPQEPSSARASKSDTLVSNKMHALVEYETSQQAEKAVDKLNDERNWRKGLRVRTVLRRSPKSVMRLKRPDFDHFAGSDDESPHSQMSSDSPTSEAIHSPEAHVSTPLAYGSSSDFFSVGETVAQGFLSHANCKFHSQRITRAGPRKGGQEGEGSCTSWRHTARSLLLPAWSATLTHQALVRHRRSVH